MINKDQVGVFYVLVLIKIQILLKLQLHVFFRLTQQRMTSVLFPCFCFNAASCLYSNMLNLLPFNICTYTKRIWCLSVMFISFYIDIC